MKKVVLSTILVLAIAGFAMANGAADGSGASYPERTVEFVAPASAGGGTDTFCRLIVDIIQKNDLVDGNIVVINKPGGGGTVGVAYATDPKRDGDHTLVALNGAQALGVRASKEVDGSALTPIAAVAMDNVLFVGTTDSEYPDLDSVIAAAKAAPGTLAVGVADNLDRLSVELINQEIGIELTSVYFDSAGEIASAMLGGHVDFGIMNPNECLGHIQAGSMFAVSSFTTERLSGDLAGAPTFTELGYSNIQFQMFRGIMGGAGMSDEARDFWVDVLEQVAGSEQFKNDYINKKMLEGSYMPADKFGPYVTESAEDLYTRAKAIGLLD